MATENCPDILGVCETFLSPNISNNQIQIKGYDFLRKDRADILNKTGGGILLYFRNSVKCIRRPELEISKLETIWAEIQMPNAKPFLICSAYRPPNVYSDWIDLFEEELSLAQTTGLEYILMGDFNIDLNSSTNSKWSHLIQLFDLKQLITEPTRVTQTSSTLIDHVYTTTPATIVESFVSQLSLSDHFPVCFTRKMNSKISKNQHTTASHRCFKHFDEEIFLNELNTDLQAFQVGQQHIDDDLAIWFTIILQQLNKHAPIKIKRVKSKYLPEWFTPDITDMQQKRDTYKRLKLWDDYRKSRNKVRLLIRQAKRNHFLNKVDTCKNSAAIWKHMRAINKGDISSTSNLPAELIISNKCILDSEKIATELNKFFATIAENFKASESEVFSLDVDKIKTFVNSKVPNSINFHIPLITIDEVTYYIRRLDLSKTTGLDGLGPRILKLASSCISPSIATLINKSIVTGQFPSQLKEAKIFPIFKSGSKSDPSNYRPISILPTISKIFEKHVNKHLMGYLHKYNLLNETQSGFRPKHSCQSALIKLTDHWLKCIDDGDLIGTLFLDFRKAFDLVNHNLLIEKLSLYKFSSLSLNWFKSYLDCRKQTIQTESGLTVFSNVISGVPQGSILGPTLFLLFVNDLSLHFEYCLSDFYADDATVHINDKDINIIEHKLQTELDNASTWSKQNKLPLNYNKTTCMVLGSRPRLKECRQLNLQADNTNIQNVNAQKLLGLYVDKQLSWSDHIDHLCSVISSKISLLKQLAEYIPTDAQKRFYQGFILPLIDYGSITWGATSKANLERLTKLQKRAARIILKTDIITPSFLMFRELKWSSIDDRVKYNKAIFAYKALNDLTPSYISSLLKPMSEIHALNLRSADNGTLHIPFARTELYKGSFSCSAPKLWNSLPQTVRDSDSLITFKTRLKTIF